jgi:hypothetical protein
MRKVKPIILKVGSEAGQKRLEEDMKRKEAMKEAIRSKQPIEEIEARFGVRFVTPI